LRNRRIFPRLRVLILMTYAFIASVTLHANETGNVANTAFPDLASQISELKDELRENPDNAESRYILGILNLQLGAAIAAEKELRRAQRYGWSQQLVLPLLGEALLPQQKYQQILNEIIADSTYPESINAQILGIRGQAELGLNRLVSAEKSLQAGEMADSDALAVLLGQLGVYQEKKDAKAFKVTMTRALMLYPDNPQLLLWQGLSALMHDQIRDAESTFQRVIDHEPVGLSTRWERQARFWLVQVYIRVNELANAESHISRILKVDSDSSLANYLGAIVAFEKGAYDQARNRLVKVLDRHPEMPTARLLLGVTSYEQGSYEQAAYEISSYLVSHPQDSWAQQLLIKSYLQLDDFKRASVVLEGWASRDSENVELAESVALNALYSGKPESAIRYLKTIAPKETSHQVMLASAYLAAGETDQFLEMAAVLSEDLSFGGEYKVIFDALKRKKWFDALDGLQRLPQKLAATVWNLSLTGGLQAQEGNMKEATALFKKALLIHTLGDKRPAGISNPAGLLPNLSQREVLEGDSAKLHRIYTEGGSWEEITNGIGANSPYTYSLWAENPFSQWMRDEGVFSVSIVDSQNKDRQPDADGLGHLIEKPIILRDSRLPPLTVLMALIVIIGLRLLAGMRK